MQSVFLDQGQVLQSPTILLQSATIITGIAKAVGVNEFALVCGMACAGLRNDVIMRKVIYAE